MKKLMILIGLVLTIGLSAQSGYKPVHLIVGDFDSCGFMIVHNDTVIVEPMILCPGTNIWTNAKLTDIYLGAYNMADLIAIIRNNDFKGSEWSNE
jgi:hypothetical protein